MSRVLPFIDPKAIARAMNDPAAAGVQPLPFPHEPVNRGYVPIYNGCSTICPGCHRSNWIVGRISAECAVCTTALPLGQSTR